MAGSRRDSPRDPVSVIASPSAPAPAVQGLPRVEPRDDDNILPTTDAILGALLNLDPDTTCKDFVTDVVVFAPNDVMVKVMTDYGRSDLPTDGTTALVLSSGNPFRPCEDDDLDVPPVDSSHGDQTYVQVVFDFPSDVQAISFDLEMFSYEYPEYVRSPFNDFAFAYLDSTSFKFKIRSDPSIMDDGSPVTDGCLITVDAYGNRTNVNNVFYTGCDIVGCDSMPGFPGWETVDDDYDPIRGNDAGRTGGIQTCSPVDYCTQISAGRHTLTFTVGDVSDGIFTSVGLFDNLRCHTNRLCDTPYTRPMECEALPDAGPDKTICEGTRINFLGLGSRVKYCKGSTEYRWLENGTPCTNWQADPRYYASPVFSTSFTLEAHCVGTDQDGNPMVICTGSDSMFVQTLADVPPPDLGNFVRAVKAGDSVVFSWATAAGAASYQALRQDVEEFDAPNVVGTADVNSFTDPGVVPPSIDRPPVYYYRFRGVSCGGAPGP